MSEGGLITPQPCLLVSKKSSFFINKGAGLIAERSEGHKHKIRGRFHL